MIQTLNKHVKWRKDNDFIFICDCKRFIDLKISYDFEGFMRKLSIGVDKSTLNGSELLIFADFEKLNLLSELKIRCLSGNDFIKAMEILDNGLGKKRVRDADFLKEKFESHPDFFIGIFLDDELIGVICGFPRDDYLLISEIAVDIRFKGRKIGEKLIKKFEDVAKSSGYSLIKAGARDSVLGFYSSLDYKPVLLVQYEENYSLSDFIGFEILESGDDYFYAEVEEYSIENIEKLRKKYEKVNFQYIFVKEL